MADFDIADLFGKALDAGVGYVNSQMQIKQAKKLAKAQQGVGGMFPMLGTGNMRFVGGSSVMPAMPLNFSGGFASPQPTSFGGALSSDIFSGLGAPALANYFGGGSGARRQTYEVYTTPSGAQRVTGTRSLGSPMLWSGDIAAVRRVGRVARKLGRFVHHRRPR